MRERLYLHKIIMLSSGKHIYQNKRTNGRSHDHMIWAASLVGEQMTPAWGVACIDPSSTDGRIYKEDLVKHCYSQNIKSLGLLVSFVCFSQM